jgi:hypothetical protein
VDGNDAILILVIIMLLMTTVILVIMVMKMVTLIMKVVVEVMMMVKRPQRNWCGCRPCRNRCAVSNKQLGLSNGSSDRINKRIIAHGEIMNYSHSAQN